MTFETIAFSILVMIVVMFAIDRVCTSKERRAEAKVQQQKLHSQEIRDRLELARINRLKEVSKDGNGNKA